MALKVKDVYEVVGGTAINLQLNETRDPWRRTTMVPSKHWHRFGGCVTGRKTSDFQAYECAPIMRVASER